MPGAEFEELLLSTSAVVTIHPVVLLGSLMQFSLGSLMQFSLGSLMRFSLVLRSRSSLHPCAVQFRASNVVWFS